MKKILFVLFLVDIVFSLDIFNRYELVIKNSNGVYIEYKEKYGNTMLDTGTILMESNSDYVLFKKFGNKTRLEKQNLSFLRYNKKER